MQHKRQGLPSRVVFMALAITFSLGLCAQAQTVTTLATFDGADGSASVTFNGMQANFTVESDTYIKATVPAGATTGIVSVVTPTGTLNSNPQFVVTR